MDTTSTSALVVGGSLVGLSAALFLAQRGVATVLVERHLGSSPHPRAIGFTARTLELYRSAGLDRRIPQVPRGFQLRRARVESLAGTWFEETPWTPPAEHVSGIEYSPCTGAAIAQDRLEPILRERAIELGADVRLGTESIGFEQQADAVVATLRSPEGREYQLRAAYLIAADGHRSRIREALGVGRDGRGYLRTMRSVLFQASLDSYLEKGIRQFEIDQPDFKAFLTTYGDGRWLLMFSDDVERDETALRAMIARAVGRSDVAVEIVTTGRWELSAMIADRFASARVFLTGDAAHTLPPARGGYGANTGIEDVHNLAWKLSSVLSGTSTPRLLDTYDAERRPIAWLRHDQIFARPDYKRVAGAAAKEVPIIDDDAMELGQLYRSSAVLGAGDDLPPALRPDQWSGQPGTRAPHLWVIVDGERVSMLDLFQRAWVLLAADDRWLVAAMQAADALGVRLGCRRIGSDVLSDLDAFRTAYGLGAAGASLIRPDGYVAWRSPDLPANPSRALIAALGEASCSVHHVPTEVHPR